jgi:hypothetical protein
MRTIDTIAATIRMGIDDAQELDWLERKVDWCRTMVAGGLLSEDEAAEALQSGHARMLERGRLADTAANRP